MPGSPDPIENVTGATTTDDVSKSELVSYLKSEVRWFATAAEVRLLNLATRFRIMVGSRFFKKDTTDTTTPDDETETTACIIDGNGTRWILIEGERYDLITSTSGQAGAAEELPAVAIVTPLTLPADLPGSLAFVDVAPTSEAIFTLKSKTGVGAWTTVATVTFEAGEITGTFTLAADAALAVNDRVRWVAPAVIDATLEGFTATVAALR